MANLLPTKGNLIAAKRSRMLARTGYELMDRKRNILIRELMGMMDTAKELQGQIDAVFTEAYTALQAANIRLGICDRIAEAVDVDDSLTLRYRSVMGVELPRIPGQSPPPRPEYGMGDTCSELDECYLKFYRVKELTRRLAEVETSIYRLADAIKKTQKRANALQNIVIPGLDGTIRFITDALEEKEREEFARLKVIKRVTTKQKRNSASLLFQYVRTQTSRILAWRLFKSSKLSGRLRGSRSRAEGWYMAIIHTPAFSIHWPCSRVILKSSLMSFIAAMRPRQTMIFGLSRATWLRR